jgi:hypothetical protein
LADGFLNHPGKPLRDAAKKTLTGIDEFAKPKTLLLIWRRPWGAGCALATHDQMAKMEPAITRNVICIMFSED